MSANPYRTLARAAQSQGWTVRRTRGGHWLWTSPTGTRVVSAGTPGDRRGVLNLRAALKRAGLVLGCDRGAGDLPETATAQDCPARTNRCL